jgi:azurin
MELRELQRALTAQSNSPAKSGRRPGRGGGVQRKARQCRMRITGAGMRCSRPNEECSTCVNMSDRTPAENGVDLSRRPTMRYSILAALVFAGPAAAANCSIDLKADDAMKFDKAEVTVSASCASITINLTHAGKLPVTAMGHNVVIAPAGDVQALGTAGMNAGAAADYVPAGDARVVAHTALVGGGASTSATFPGSALKVGGDYAFFCSFPGHWAVMKGKLVVE